jgi:phospholipid-binding lipoprotein MlaA
MKRFFLLFLILSSLVYGDEFDDAEFDDSFDDEFSLVKKDNFDPLSGYNRVMTSFNDGLYTYVVFPTGNVYSAIVPKPIRESISNFFDNLQYPLRLVNNLLQLKFENSYIETQRFLLNSTVGMAGLFDPAYDWYKIEQKDEDFGQTLGYYGVGGGFHIVLPFLGPSNLRDSFSLIVDWQTDPFFYKLGLRDSLELSGFEYFNNYSSKQKEYEALKKGALDKYLLFKDIYEQQRLKDINR